MIMALIAGAAGFPMTLLEKAILSRLADRSGLWECPYRPFDRRLHSS
jgi:hypothetical protein